MVENFWGTDVILFLKLFYVCCALKLVIYTDILNALLENYLSVACVHLVNSFIQRERKNVATGSAIKIKKITVKSEINLLNIHFQSGN